MKQLEYEVAHPEYGLLSILANSLGEGDFKEAVEDHILARLRKEARDPLLDHIDNPALAEKRVSIIFKESIKNLGTKSLKRHGEIEQRPLFEVKTANQPQEPELVVSVKAHRERIQVLGYEISMTPTFNINKLRLIATKAVGRWDKIKGDSGRCDCLFQLLFGSLVNIIESMSEWPEDTRRLEDLLAVLKKCLDIRRNKSDIFTYEETETDTEEEEN
jgi:hypothetical protein